MLSVLGPGDPAAREGFTLLLSTVGADGRPHVALLSLGEVVAVASSRIRLALWPASTSAANLVPGSPSLLTFVEDAAVWAVHLQADRRQELLVPGFASLIMVETVVVEVRVDVVAYAVVESGIRFRLVDADSVLPRWAATRRALAEL